MNNIISVEDFEKLVKIFGFNHPIVTAVWNSMEKNEDNQKEFEIIYKNHMHLNKY